MCEVCPVKMPSITESTLNALRERESRPPPRPNGPIVADECNDFIYLFILGFYVASNTVQVISQLKGIFVRKPVHIVGKGSVL